MSGSKKKDPVIVTLYSPKSAPTSADRLKDIVKRPPITLEKRGKINVRIAFTLNELLSSDKIIQTRLADAVVDSQQLKELAPEFDPRMPGYFIEARGTGYSNDSPITLLAGLPDVTRASFSATKELSEDGAMPDSILAKLESSDPLLTMLCTPTVDFPEGGALAQAMRVAKQKYGMHLYSKTEDGGIMSQNPKALIIIDESIGTTKESIVNTYVKDTAGRGIHTPSTSLISAIVRTYPPSAIRLVWNDQGGRVPFDASAEVMFFIPEAVANHVIEYIARRKKIVSALFMALNDTVVAVQASPMHGDWQYDAESNEYENRDTGKRYSADTQYEFCMELEVVMRYHIKNKKSCAITNEHQFYPMPVWPKSGIVNGKPSSADVKPYPGTLYDSVKEKLGEVSDQIEENRRTAMLKRANRDVPVESIESSSSSSSGAASSVADDD